MQFIDECKIFVRSGSGGNGSFAFKRGPYQPRGGPCGGDGGSGGSVILTANEQLATLRDMSYQHSYIAKNGEQGRSRDQYGKNAPDLFVDVPLGTIVKDEKGNLLADLCVAGQQFVAAKGGKGGRGNLHFATSTNQAPTFAEPGGLGEEKNLILELKLMADVGLLGYPNVGKSSLIAKVSAAKPKIANYPFTTLTPGLGVVRLPLGALVKKIWGSFTMADIPGLIEGAHLGHGMGHQFLRHLERTKVLIHLLEVSLDENRDPWKDYCRLCNELSAYSEELKNKKQFVVLGKLDLSYVKDSFAYWQALFRNQGISLFGISTATGEGISSLMEKIFHEIKRSP